MLIHVLSSKQHSIVETWLFRIQEQRVSTGKWELFLFINMASPEQIDFDSVTGSNSEATISSTSASKSLVHR